MSIARTKILMTVARRIYSVAMVSWKVRRLRDRGSIRPVGKLHLPYRPRRAAATRIKSLMARLPVTRSSGKRPLMNRSRIRNPYPRRPPRGTRSPGGPVINGHTPDDRNRRVPPWNLYRLVPLALSLFRICPPHSNLLLFSTPSTVLPLCWRSTGFVETRSLAFRRCSCN